MKLKEYLSRAIFLVWPEPRLSTTSHLSTTLVAPLQTITSILWSFVLVFELLNNLDIWNFLHFFSEKGFLVTANDESTETEYCSDGFAFPSSHVEIVTYINAHIKLDIGRSHYMEGCPTNKHHWCRNNNRYMHCCHSDKWLLSDVWLSGFTNPDLRHEDFTRSGAQDRIPSCGYIHI